MPWNYDDDTDRTKTGTRRWGGAGESNNKKKPQGSDSDSERKQTEELLNRAEPMIEQINNLYGHYVSGLEKRPPNEQRKQLETIMTQLLGMKGTAADRFRISSLNTRFTTFRERWDKIMRDLESGKIQRAIKKK